MNTKSFSIMINGKEHQLSKRCSISNLLEHFHLPLQPGMALTVNEEVIPKTQYQSVMINPKDRIEIIHAVGGG